MERRQLDKETSMMCVILMSSGREGVIGTVRLLCGDGGMGNMSVFLELVLRA